LTGPLVVLLAIMIMMSGILLIWTHRKAGDDANAGSRSAATLRTAATTPYDGGSRHAEQTHDLLLASNRMTRHDLAADALRPDRRSPPGGPRRRTNHQLALERNLMRVLTANPARAVCSCTSSTSTTPTATPMTIPTVRRLTAAPRCRRARATRGAAAHRPRFICRSRPSHWPPTPATSSTGPGGDAEDLTTPP
jgi:hypothetical protein